MARLWHILFFCVYALLSAGAWIAAPVMFGFATDPIGEALGVLSGAVVFLAGAVVHEGWARREDLRNNTRRLRALKRAYDRALDDLSVTRDEIRRIFEVIEAEGGADLIARLRAASYRDPAPDPIPTRNADIPPPAMPFGGGFDASRLPEDPPDRPRRPDRPFRQAADDESSDTVPSSAQEMRDVAAEMRVLHSLVEQLYADRGRGGSSSGGAREPQLGAVPGAPPQRGARAELRVVGETAADHGVDRDRILDIVREGLRRDRVDLYLQPIVSLPQRKRRFYECYSRIRAEDGTVLGPDRYIAVARDAGLLTAVDNMLLFRCVQLLRKLQGRDIAAVFFCNIAPNSLADREFFKDFIEYMESHSELAPSLVLELSQADLDTNSRQLEADFRRLGRLGYRFSLDQVSNLDLDLGALAGMHVRFVKIDAAVILEHLEAGGAKASKMRMLKQSLDEAEIDLVVERIETESQLVELLDFNIDYGQGFLFGEPRPSKDPGTASATA